MSKKPPLGYDFFMELAEDMVSQRLAMRYPDYSFVEARRWDRKRKKNISIRFWLQGRMREMYMERYVELWRERHGEDPPDTPFLAEQHFDKIARREELLNAATLEQVLEAREDAIIQARAERKAKEVYCLGYLLTEGPSPGVFSAHSDGSVFFTEGDGSLRWHLNVPEKEHEYLLGRQLRKLPLRHGLAEQAEEWLDRFEYPHLPQNQLSREYPTTPRPESNRHGFRRSSGSLMSEQYIPVHPVFGAVSNRERFQGR